MRFTRRGALGVTALGAAGFAAPAMAQPRIMPTSVVEIAPARFEVIAKGRGSTDYRPAMEALAAYARDELRALGLPGMTLSITDADGFTAAVALGWADIRARQPVVSDQLFQIGSISKSFLALTLLSLADQGRIDLDAPLARYLPGAPWPDAPITVAQVMSHTAGLPDGSGIFPRVPDGRLWTGFPAGSKFSYSNTGFDLLGAAVTHVTGAPYETAIAERVRAPLGLADIAASINEDNRARFPKAYQPWDQTLAAEMPGAVLGEAKWDPEDSPAGSIAASAPMMAGYVRALIALGAGKGAPILSDAAARRFATGVIASDADFGPGSKYALGVAIQPVDGLPTLHHTGGMVAFSSSFHADPAAGVGAFASVNARIGGYRPRQTTAYAIRLMRAARAGRPLPAPPDPLGPSRIKKPEAILGRFVGPDGAVFTIAAGGDFPTITGLGETAPLYVADGMVTTPHRALGRHSLDPEMENGQAKALWWGETLFGRDQAAPQPEAPERLRALAGLYINRDPWVGYASILARGDKLVAEGAGTLVERGDYWTFEKDVGGVERVRFDGMLNGRATRINLSGTDLERLNV